MSRKAYLQLFLMGLLLYVPSQLMGGNSCDGMKEKADSLALVEGKAAEGIDPQEVIHNITAELSQKPSVLAKLDYLKEQLFKRSVLGHEKSEVLIEEFILSRILKLAENSHSETIQEVALKMIRMDSRVLSEVLKESTIDRVVGRVLLTDSSDFNFVRYLVAQVPRGERSLFLRKVLNEVAVSDRSSSMRDLVIREVIWWGSYETKVDLFEILNPLPIYTTSNVHFRELANHMLKGDNEGIASKAFQYVDQQKIDTKLLVSALRSPFESVREAGEKLLRSETSYYNDAEAGQRVWPLNHDIANPLSGSMVVSELTKVGSKAEVFFRDIPLHPEHNNPIQSNDILGQSVRLTALGKQGKVIKFVEGRVEHVPIHAGDFYVIRPKGQQSELYVAAKEVERIFLVSSELKKGTSEYDLLNDVYVTHWQNEVNQRSQKNFQVIQVEGDLATPTILTEAKQVIQKAQDPSLVYRVLSLPLIAVKERVRKLMARSNKHPADIIMHLDIEGLNGTDIRSFIDRAVENMAKPLYGASDFKVPSQIQTWFKEFQSFPTRQTNIQNALTNLLINRQVLSETLKKGPPYPRRIVIFDMLTGQSVTHVLDRKAVYARDKLHAWSFENQQQIKKITGWKEKQSDGLGTLYQVNYEQAILFKLLNRTRRIMEEKIKGRSYVSEPYKAFLENLQKILESDLKPAKKYIDRIHTEGFNHEFFTVMARSGMTSAYKFTDKITKPYLFVIRLEAIALISFSAISVLINYLDFNSPSEKHAQAVKQTITENDELKRIYEDSRFKDLIDSALDDLCLNSLDLAITTLEKAQKNQMVLLLTGLKEELQFLYQYKIYKDQLNCRS